MTPVKLSGIAWLANQGSAVPRVSAARLIAITRQEQERQRGEIGGGAMIGHLDSTAASDLGFEPSLL